MRRYYVAIQTFTFYEYGMTYSYVLNEINENVFKLFRDDYKLLHDVKKDIVILY